MHEITWIIKTFKSNAERLLSILFGEDCPPYSHRDLREIFVHKGFFFLGSRHRRCLWHHLSRFSCCELSCPQICSRSNQQLYVFWTVWAFHRRALVVYDRNVSIELRFFSGWKALFLVPFTHILWKHCNSAAVRRRNGVDMWCCICAEGLRG